jgi:gamma-glutamylcyclotransferase (GGCT)/AIG2-like uncharacterized protein YtfP
VHGRLYDTGWGWPAAVFGGSSATVPGLIVTLGLDQEQRALASLDAIEAVEQGLFTRVHQADSGLTCRAYHWPADTSHFTPIGLWRA